MVKLTPQEKESMSIRLAEHLPKIRELLHVNQKEFAELSGISVPRLSAIENHHYTMTWSQLTSILFVCACNLSTKEYVYANKIFDIRALQFFQRKDENIPPMTNICVNERLFKSYQE